MLEENKCFFVRVRTSSVPPFSVYPSVHRKQCSVHSRTAKILVMTLLSHNSVVIDPQLCCMAVDFLKSIRQLCFRSLKSCLIGYVLEQTLGVIVGGGGASKVKV